jgi:uncharacterized membrane protein (DUF4010 family)
MSDFLLVWKTVLSLLLGAFIGLERESYERSQEKGGTYMPKKIPGIGLGVRTFSLITLLGTIAGFAGYSDPTIMFLLSGTFFLLVIASYILSSMISKDVGLTTEIAMIMSYLIGLFIARDIFPIQLLIAITIIMVLILSLKQSIRSFISGLNRSEVMGFISYGIVALVILPLLPNRWFRLSDVPEFVRILSAYNINVSSWLTFDIINPFYLWLVVAIITGIDVIGYLLGRFIGEKRGIIISSLIGGFVSSTTHTQSLAVYSLTGASTSILVAASLYSFIASYSQHFIVIGSLNPSLMIRSTPMILCVIIVALILAIFYTKKSLNSSIISIHNTALHNGELKLFSLGPALKFALLFSSVQLIVKIATQLLGNSGFLLSISFAALTGMDSVLVTISQLAGKNIDMGLAIVALIIANTVNILAKIFYCRISGTREFMKQFGITMAIVSIASLVGLLF